MDRWVDGLMDRLNIIWKRFSLFFFHDTRAVRMRGVYVRFRCFQDRPSAMPYISAISLKTPNKEQKPNRSSHVTRCVDPCGVVPFVIEQSLQSNLFLGVEHCFVKNKHGMQSLQPRSSNSGLSDQIVELQMALHFICLERVMVGDFFFFFFHHSGRMGCV